MRGAPLFCPLLLVSFLNLSAFAPASAPEITNREPLPDEWGYRPPDHNTVPLNPPSLTWVHDDKAHRYTVQWSPQGDFKTAQTAIDIPWPTYTHNHTLKPGEYFWRYRYQTADGQVSNWSQARSFTVPPDAVDFPMPDRAQQRQRVPQGHPRLFLTPEDLPRIREAAAGAAAPAFDKLRQAADRVIKAGPTPEPDHLGSARDKENAELVKYWWPNRQQSEKACEEAELLAFVGLVSGEKVYQDAARKWVLHLASWDPDGPTNFRLNCEAAKPLLYRLPRAYDWAYPAFTEADRHKIQKTMQKRIADAWESGEVRRGVGHLNQPYNSHGNRVWHKIGEAGIAFLGEVPEADTWLDYAVNKFYAVYPVWSDDDGGWHEGVSYWSGYMGKAVGWLQVSREALGIDGLKKPFFSQVGDFPLYVAPPGSPNAGFGDSSYRPPSDSIGGFLGYFIRASVGSPAGAHAPYWQWWADQWHMSDRQGILGFLDQTNLPDPPAAKPPTDLPTSKVFHGIGVASLHTTLLDSRQDLHFLFKSSPFGSQSHGHNPQNSFQLNAYGEALLDANTYRDLHGSKFHYKWVHSTIAQNAVLVNNKGQKAHAAEPQGRILDEQLTTDFDYLAGDATPSYEGRLKRARRHVVLLKNNKLASPLVVLYDELRADQPSTYQFLLHASKPFEVNTQASTLTVQKPRASATVQYLSATPLDFRQWDGYDPPPTTPFPNQWHVEASTTSPLAAFDLITVIVPTRAGQAVECKALRVENNSTIGVELNLNGQTARVLFRKSEAPTGPVSFEGVELKGPVAVQVD